MTRTLDRRLFLRGTAATAGAALLTACGGTAAPPPAVTRTVPSAYGPVDVPVAPQRVVAVSYNTPFQLQAVGVQPVGAFDYTALYDQLTTGQKDMLERATPIGTFGEPDLERIAGLAPDVLVGEAYEVDEELRARLSAIAPTVIVEGVSRGDWKAISSGIADAAGATDGLATAREAYEAEVGRLRERYAATLTGQVWAAFSFGDEPGQFSLQFPTGAVGGVLAELDVTFVPEIGTQRPDSGYASYSQERLSLLEPATVAVRPVAVDGSEYPGIQAILDSPLHTRLPVARSGRSPTVDLYGTTDYATGLTALADLESRVLSVLP